MSGAEQPDIDSRMRTKAVVAVGSAAARPRRNGPVEPERLHIQCKPGRVGLPSSVVHELRTPLTSIHGYAQVLQRMMREEPRAKNALAVVVRESARLTAMLNELSELAEIQSGEVLSTPVKLEAHQIVDGVVHEIERRDGGAHPIVLQGSAVAHCNPTLLSQALVHVLSNAIAYSQPGSPIDVTVSARDGQVEIDVADRGISVERDDAERVYEPFERGANARLAGVRGLGLGLSLARAALERAGGRIEHEPRDGGGTLFRITVPGA